MHFDVFAFFIRLCEPKREKTLLRTCAPIEDSDRPARSRRLIRIYLGAFWITKDAKFLHVNNEDSDQTARMRRLI